VRPSAVFGILVALEQKWDKDTSSTGADDTGDHFTGERPVSRVRPIPEAYRNIQVNFCKTPGCPNLCVQPFLGRIRTGRSNASDGYRVTGASTESSLLCTYCGVESRVKSNKAVHEEFQRQAAHIFTPSPLVCSTEGCQSDPRHPTKAFQKFGKSDAGSLRFRCRSCKATFSIPSPTARQRRTRANAPVFRHLVNKVPLNRIVEFCGVSFPTLYDKIRFIHRQCSLFAVSREARLPDVDLGRRFLCTDRQDYIVNWGSRTNRKTIQLTAVATADRDSGYLFAFSPNFDASLDQDQAEAAWLEAGDAAKPPQMRDTARIWTRADYEQSLARAAAKKLLKPAGRKGDEVTVAVEQREDLDAPEPMVEGQQLPSRGVQVHADYLVHGHYHYLRHLLRGTSRLNFSLDGDSGLLAACMAAFSDRVRDRTAEVVQVRIAKELSIDDRRREIADTLRTFAAAVAALRRPVRLKEDGLDDQRAATAVVAEKIGRLRAASPDPERKLQRVWVKNPAPDAAEPRKFWRYVSDNGHLYDHDVAFLLRMSTLWPVDKVFAMLRRRVAMFERPVSSVRRARRLWQIYAAYDPRMVALMLEIFRVRHNWLWRGDDGMTPAERLGLPKGEVREDHILGYDLRDVVERLWSAEHSHSTMDALEPHQ
jgi:transposase-like protein